MTFTDFARNYYQTLPLRRKLPAMLQVPSATKGGGIIGPGKNVFWKEIENLRKSTDKSAENFSEKHQGSTGWEYEEAIVLYDDQFFYSRMHTSRNYYQTGNSYRLEPKTEYNAKSQTITDKIYINGRHVGQKRYKGETKIKSRNRRIQEGTFPVSIIGHLHSHPQNQTQQSEKRFYSFYSPQDVMTLMNSNYLFLGLVADRLWLLVKTQEARPALSLESDLQEATKAEIRGEEAELLKLAGLAASKSEFGLYVGNFGTNKLKRIDNTDAVNKREH